MYLNTMKIMLDAGGCLMISIKMQHYTCQPHGWERWCYIYEAGRQSKRPGNLNAASVVFLQVLLKDLHAPLPEVLCPNPELETQDHTLGQFFRVAQF